MEEELKQDEKDIETNNKEDIPENIEEKEHNDEEKIEDSEKVTEEESTTIPEKEVNTNTNIPPSSKNILEGIVPEPSNEDIEEYYIPENLSKYKKQVDSAGKKVRNRDMNVEEYFSLTNKYLDEISKIEDPKKQQSLIKELRTNFENSRVDPILYIGGLDVQNIDDEVYKDFTKEILEYNDESRNITVHFVKSREKDLRYEFPTFLIHFTWIPFLIGLFVLKFIVKYDKDKLNK